MSLNTDNDPYLMEAAKELDAEFPGAVYDGSLQNYQKRKAFKKRITKKIIFHGVFYSVFVIGIHFLFREYSTSIFSSMIYGLTWFLVYIALKPGHEKPGPYNIPGIDDQIGGHLRRMKNGRQ